MAKRELKVFHGLVNYGTQAGLFAKELGKHGIKAISVVSEDPAKRVTNVEISYSEELVIRFFQRIFYFLKKIKWFLEFNTFHFYFGHTLFRNQWDLPLYKFFGKKVIFEYLGNDIRPYRTLIKRYELPDSHDFVKKMDDHDKKIRKRVKYEKKHIDYLVSCLPTHVEWAKEFDIEVKEILPLAIDLDSIKYFPNQIDPRKDTITILHAPTNRIFKGTNYIIEAITKLKNEGFKIDFRLIEGVSHNELFKEYQNCDIFIDQISVGWYGTAALEAMAVGRPTCAFIDERYLQYIDYGDEIPIINVNRNNLFLKLRTIIQDVDLLNRIGKESRTFVEKYHDVSNVTEKLINIYKNKVWDE